MSEKLHDVYVDGLRHSFGPREVLTDVSLSIDRGEIVLLIGPNGAGKTTLLSILSGLIRPDGGGVFWKGNPVTKCLKEWKGAIGVVPEQLFLFDGLSLEENLLYTGALYGISNDEVRHRTELLLTWFDLADKRDTRAGEGSFGMRKKLAFALALLHDPGILLLDEALNGIDVRTGYNLRLMIRALADRGKAVLMSTHNLGAAHEIADRFVILKDGNVAVDIRAEDMKRDGMDLESLYVEVLGIEKKTAGDLPWLS